MATRSGKPEAGIMSPEQTRAQDDELRARYGGQGGEGWKRDAAGDVSQAPLNQTAQEERARTSGVTRPSHSIAGGEGRSVADTRAALSQKTQADQIRAAREQRTVAERQEWEKKTGAGRVLQTPEGPKIGADQPLPGLGFKFKT